MVTYVVVSLPMNPSQPYWITLAGVFGLGAVVGSVVSHFLASRLQRLVWIQDNKKAEWRELIDGLNEDISRMAVAFEHGVARAASDPLLDWYGAMDGTDRLFRCRIFIAGALEKHGLIQKWDDLKVYVLSSDNPRNPRERGGIATLSGYTARAYELRARVISVSRDDLGIEPTGRWYRFW